MQVHETGKEDSQVLFQVLFSVKDSARLLGGLSPWTLRKHAQRGNIRVVRLGLRVLLDSEELDRIRREGLPRLTAPRAPKHKPILRIRKGNPCESRG
jgi:hypothetical protein